MLHNLLIYFCLGFSLCLVVVVVLGFYLLSFLVITREEGAGWVSFPTVCGCFPATVVELNSLLHMPKISTLWPLTEKKSRVPI